MKGNTSLAEWLIAGVGALLVCSAGGFLVYEALTSPDTPPVLEVVVDSTVATRQGYLVQFRVHNHGHRTAAGLQLQGELSAGGRVVENAAVTIDYVPPRATRRATLIFRRDPRRYRLAILPRGFDEP